MDDVMGYPQWSQEDLEQLAFEIQVLGCMARMVMVGVGVAAAAAYLGWRRWHREAGRR